MIWAALALLGVPIWLVVGALGAALWSRRTFARNPDVFPVRLRQPGQSWPRRGGYARVVHDVLVVNTGLALVRTTVSGVREARVAAGAADGVRGIDDPLIVDLTLDDGSQMQLAAPKAAQARFDDLMQ